MNWNDLPDELATHFNFTGEADGYSSKKEAVFFLPLIMLGVHLFCVVMCSIDPKSKNISPKMLKLIYWLIPVMAIFIQTAILLQGMGFIKNNTFVLAIVLGILFVALGNYLPKTKQNYTVRIKLPWTLDDETNWNKTHRLAGKFWVVGGLIILLNGFIQFFFPVMTALILVLMIAAPVIYSYLLSRKE